MDNDFNVLAVIMFSLAGVLALRFSKSLLGSLLSPPALYTGLWFFSLALFHLGIVRYYPLEWETLSALVSTIALFLFGAVVAVTLARRKHDSSRQPPTSEHVFEHRHLHWAIALLFAIGVIGTLTYYWRLHQLIGIESLWLNPIRVRFEESQGGLRRVGWIGLARSFLIPCFVLAVIYLRLSVGNRRTKLLLGIIAGLSFVLVLPNSGRTTLLTMVTWAGLVVIYLTESMGKTFSLRKYSLQILIGGAFIVAYFAATNIVLNKTLSQVDRVFASTALNEPLIGWGDFIHYIVSGFPAFQVLTQYPPNYDQPVSLTFGAISRILNEIDPASFAYPDYVQPFVYVPLPTNIYTYLDTFFLDFGWVGVAIFPFVIGLLTTALYLWMLRAPSVGKIYVAALMGQCILQTTGVNRFSSFLIAEWIVLPLVLLKLFEWFAITRPYWRRSALTVTRERPAR